MLFRWGLLAFLLLCLGTPIAAAQEGGGAPVTDLDEPAGDELVKVPYTIELRGAEGDLDKTIRSASRLITLEDRPPGSVVALRRRVDNDFRVVQDALRAEGYYSGEVDITANEAVAPIAVVIDVRPGPRFTIAAFDVHFEQPDRRAAPVEVPLDEVRISIGQPARTKDILDAQQNVIIAFARRAYPLAEIADREVVVDHASHTVRVSVVVNTGPFAAFGEADIRGLQDVDRDFVRNRLPWSVGEPFDLRRLEEARKRLVETNLFASVRLTPADALGADGRLPVVVELQERKFRTIGGTLSYGTDEGFGIEASWEHRNLFGQGERLRTRLFYNSLNFGGEAAFRNPDVFGVDWDLISNLELREVDTDAYDATASTASVGADLRLSEFWRLTTSASLEYLIEEELGRSRDFTLLGLPVVAKRDTSDDLLDPTRGNRLRLQMTPYADIGGETGAFLRFEAEDSAYFQLMTEPNVVLAGWIDFGSIVGGTLDDLPPSKRFYAGGGGSVRAYGFQHAGPRKADGSPSGGLSLLAFGGEARIRVTEDIGIVPFIEAGTVYPERYPDFSEPLRWGVGLGVRYYTAIGPIRADIAVPLNRQDEDNSFQLYLSFGQAF